MILCQLNNVSKRFSLPSASLFAPAKEIRAVDGVDLTIVQAETMSVVGESGSGKTTLGRLIADLYRPDVGAVLFEGSDIRSAGREEYRHFRRSVQVVFQDPFSSLDPRFTVRRILKEAFSLQKDVDGSGQLHRMSEMLKAVELSDDVLLRYPHEFSGGERQRLAVARALLTSPKLVILDEAVSSLDVLVQKQILQLLNELKKRFGLTYFFISHNLRVVTQISDKIAVMFQGKILETGPVKEVANNPQHPYTKELLAAAINYKSQNDQRNWSVPEDRKGRFVGPEHWVMDVIES